MFPVAGVTYRVSAGFYSLKRETFSSTAGDPLGAAVCLKFLFAEARDVQQHLDEAAILRGFGFLFAEARDVQQHHEHVATADHAGQFLFAEARDVQQHLR